MVLSYRLEPGFYEKSDRLVKSIRDKSEWPIQVQKRSQYFIRTHNETLAAVAAIMASIVRSIGEYKPPFPIPKTQSAFRLRAQ
jgi:hypothetical protein